MFPGVAELAGADESMVVAAITGWACIEAAASARRLAEVAELVTRRLGEDPESSQWACDDWDATAAEVGAALHLSHGRASGQMSLAVALRERLPQVGVVFAEGMISAQVASAIAWHTTLIKDDEALRRVDEALARDALRYGPLSVAKTAEAIEAIVDYHDPGALRHTRVSARSREVVIDKRSTKDGTTDLWGRLYAVDAEVLDRRLMQMAHDVCDADPRTIAQRRADALGVLAAGGQRLVCGCGDAKCPTADSAGHASAAVVHIIADAAVLQTPVDAHHNGEGSVSPPFTGEMPVTEGRAAAADPEPDVPAGTAPPALVWGGPVLPAPLVAELIRNGAAVRPVRFPATSEPEPGYRPSTALDEFVRCRDMTCRFPGCDKPAEFCDVDHTIAYDAGGPTHPSNLKCVCRKHHLVKTFWRGWRDRQLPDGTVIWTTPAGTTYTTHPGSRLLFPGLCASTGEVSAPRPPQHPGASRTLMMPRRQRTRAQDRAHRINAERALNADHVAERNRPPPF